MAVAILVRVIDRPVEAMHRAKGQPGSWWLPALLLISSLAVLVWLTAPFEVARANAQMQEVLARMPEAQRDIVEQQGRAMTTGPIYLVSGIGFGVLGMIIGWITRSGIIHLSAVALGGNSQWPGTFGLVVWSMLPFAVRNLVQTGCVLMNHQVIAHQGLSFLVASGQPMLDAQSLLYNLLASIDPFTVWHLVLFALAIGAALQIPRLKAALVAVIVWAVVTGLRLLPVLISASLSANMFG